MNVRELIAQTEKNLLREHHLTLEKATPWQLEQCACPGVYERRRARLGRM